MGTSHVLATMRQKFWVVKGTAAVKRLVHRCLSCKARSMKPAEQLMAPLPPCRVDPDYAFAATGVDYFGPFFVRDGRQSRKRYGCIFSCLKTRTLHIEVAHSLSIDSFLMARSRFVNRRGSPKEMFSDRGSNFVGAELELRQFLKSLDCDPVDKRMIANGIE
ncbi:hypothetical protein CLF_109567, partial [Clonorchis sinensis]